MEDDKIEAQCKVINGKYGPQVVYNGIFYKVGSFSKPRVKIGKEYMFLLEKSEYGDKTTFWANLPPKSSDDDADESLPPRGNGLEEVPEKPKKGRRTSTKLPIEYKVYERIADALERIADSQEAIEEYLDIWVNGKDEESN